jgi:hypothetical protein
MTISRASTRTKAKEYNTLFIVTPPRIDNGCLRDLLAPQEYSIGAFAMQQNSLCKFGLHF